MSVIAIAVTRGRLQFTIPTLASDLEMIKTTFFNDVCCSSCEGCFNTEGGEEGEERESGVGRVRNRRCQWYTHK